VGGSSSTAEKEGVQGESPSEEGEESRKKKKKNLNERDRVGGGYPLLVNIHSRGNEKLKKLTQKGRHGI